jgi:hypothetical protein
MTFALIPVQLDQDVVTECNNLMNIFNGYAQNDEVRFKQGWEIFWASDRDVTRMQAILDTFATHTYIDPATGLTVNALTAYFTKALAEIADVKRELPTAFSDAVYEVTAVITNGVVSGATALQPDGTLYQKYLFPGWYYTVDNTGRMIVSGPVVYGILTPVS